MDKEEALQEGIVSKITPAVEAVLPYLSIISQELPRELRDYPAEMSTAYKTACFIRKNMTTLREEEDFKMANFRTRSIDDLITQGYYPTCSDTGLLFRTLMIAQNIPTSYIETFDEGLYLHGWNHGHIYARVFTEQGNFLFDPTNYKKEDGTPAIFNQEEDLFFEDRRVIVAEGKDHADFGIHRWESWKAFKKERRQKTLNEYERLLDWDYQTKKLAIRK